MLFMSSQKHILKGVSNGILTTIYMSNRYSQAVRANMAVGSVHSEFDEPYYDLESPLVQEQIESHGEQ